MTEREDDKITREKIATIRARLDQHIESAKAWISKDRGETFNAQAAPLWFYMNTIFEKEIDEVMSRFAIIGFQHVLTLIEDARDEAKKASET